MGFEQDLGGILRVVVSGVLNQKKSRVYDQYLGFGGVHLGLELLKYRILQNSKF